MGDLAALTTASLPRELAVPTLKRHAPYIENPEAFNAEARDFFAETMSHE
jgi:pimeloyl-ACP methyl ester carboxylesterase